jgi:respiratory nitrate reductase alpha subunit-like protein
MTPGTVGGSGEGGSMTAGATAAVAAHEFFRRGEASAEGWSMLIAKERGWESTYRDR